LGAELVYDGNTMGWQLRWEGVRELQVDNDDT
jgi:hypothetical protein